MSSRNMEQKDVIRTRQWSKLKFNSSNEHKVCGEKKSAMLQLSSKISYNAKLPSLSQFAATMNVLVDRSRDGMELADCAQHISFLIKRESIVSCLHVRMSFRNTERLKEHVKHAQCIPEFGMIEGHAVMTIVMSIKYLINLDNASIARLTQDQWRTELLDNLIKFLRSNRKILSHVGMIHVVIDKFVWLMVDVRHVRTILFLIGRFLVVI